MKTIINLEPFEMPGDFAKVWNLCKVLLLSDISGDTSLHVDNCVESLVPDRIILLQF